MYNDRIPIFGLLQAMWHFWGKSGDKNYQIIEMSIEKQFFKNIIFNDAFYFLE